MKFVVAYFDLFHYKKIVFTKKYTDHIYSTIEHNITITDRVNKSFTCIHVDDTRHRHFFTVSRSKT